MRDQEELRRSRIRLRLPRIHTVCGLTVNKRSNGGIGNLPLPKSSFLVHVPHNNKDV
jgi:hypothetical protein